MTQRLNYSEQSPELFKKLSAFSMAAGNSSIDATVRHLVEIRASQINGCGLCVDMHIKQAAIHGERPLRLHHLVIWRESPLFSGRERAALEWTEILTRIPEHGVPDEVFERVRAHLNDKEMADLTFVIMAINAWNRAGVAFRTEPGSLDAAYGLDKANLS
ncbi:carboxymuconolactone decarboxylase family protein [Diaphorobacter sp. HDW4A]|uniref:carboxymuconolactone decarboxylase family protein n=1 Tax=Diaphorobacter sp. HDW4A TaxID=2714924 RepID=UPI00140BA407|nr:carboxymuconolactone decarboxylase family protein [Diaphorobacter sp. HDW4A]QIL83180.1 carboxymuconolactone decarboxylase family protein [Diaphorobacter sp. HDW4A]